MLMVRDGVAQAPGAGRDGAGQPAGEIGVGPGALAAGVGVLGHRPKISRAPAPMSSLVSLDESAFSEAVQVSSNAVDMQSELLSQLFGAGFALELPEQLEQSGPSRLSKHISGRGARHLHGREFYTASLCKASWLC